MSSRCASARTLSPQPTLQPTHPKIDQKKHGRRRKKKERWRKKLHKCPASYVCLHEKHHPNHPRKRPRTPIVNAWPPMPWPPCLGKSFRMVFCAASWVVGSNAEVHSSKSSTGGWRTTMPRRHDTAEARGPWWLCPWGYSTPKKIVVSIYLNRDLEQLSYFRTNQKWEELGNLMKFVTCANQDEGKPTNEGWETRSKLATLST